MRAVLMMVSLVLAVPCATGAVAADPVAPATPRYSVETTSIGVLLDNPATKAILVENAPELTENDSFSAWRGLTLRAVQKLVGQSLRDEQLDAIQAAFDKISK